MRGGDEAERHMSKMYADRWKKLEIWKIADELAYKTYLHTRHFPTEERYGMTSQLRRASLSIPTNIVEGYSRKGDRELSYFINIALGSLAETKYLFYFANRLGFFHNSKYDELNSIAEKLGKKLWRFYEKVKS